MPAQRRPTRADLTAAKDARTVEDILGPGLDLLLVGINPGLHSGATGQHFARPGNRFWPAMHEAGLTPRLLHPSEANALLGQRIGLTKLVHRATATAAELSREELRTGGEALRGLVRAIQPRAVCFLGAGAYCMAFEKKAVVMGPQPDGFEGAALWVLPNPSGLNANYQLPDFVRMFKELRKSVRAYAGPCNPKPQALRDTLQNFHRTGAPRSRRFGK
jgi:TDG/mug DNA glycosylase family protein